MSGVRGRLGVTTLLLLQVLLLQQDLTGGTLLQDQSLLPEDEELTGNPDIRIPHIPIERDKCNTDDECIELMDNFDKVVYMDPDNHIAHPPYCDIPDITITAAAEDDNSDSTSATEGMVTTAAPLGVCTCGRDNTTGQDLCPSWTLTWQDVAVWYCGPCGRIGSVCDEDSNCTYINTHCDESINTCVCDDSGVFYELYFCYIPYYGFKMALQSTLIIGVVIVICLFLATAYNALRMRRIRQLQALGLWNSGSVVRDSPPEDTPPKYDDVVENLPTYQDALQMEENVDGIVNTAFEEDNLSLPPSYEEIKSNIKKPLDISKTNTSHIQKENIEVKNVHHAKQENNNESSNEVNKNEKEVTQSLDDVSVKKELVKEEIDQVPRQPIEQPIQSALQGIQL